MPTLRTTLAALAAGLAVTLAPYAASADETTSPTPTPTESAAPVSDEQRLSPYVAPSVVFISIKWEGWLYDKQFDEYLNDAYPFTITGTCTGYVVNPNGWIGTAGHCVDPAEVRTAWLAEGVNWAIDNGWYSDVSDDTIIDHVLDRVRVEGQETTKGPDRTVEVSWGRPCPASTRRTASSTGSCSSSGSTPATPPC